MEVRDRLVAKRLDGHAVYPLSEVHYKETWKQRDPRRRSELAVEMALLSNFITLAPPRSTWPQELDLALYRRYGRPTLSNDFRVFGRGISFAVGEEEPSDVGMLDLESRFLLEWQALRSPDEGHWKVERLARTDKDGRLADDASAMSRALREWHASPREREQHLRIQTLVGLDYAFLQRLILADVTPDDVAAMGGEGLEDLVSDVPTLWVLAELRRLRHQNPGQRFTSNDLNDLRALAVAVVYCDVVIADKAWVHFLKRTDLPERFGTVVSADPALAAAS
ncbi:MAG: hypothetical protein WD269_09520 [Acidimicrobiia bacterium]